MRGSKTSADLGGIMWWGIGIGGAIAEGAAARDGDRGAPSGVGPRAGASVDAGSGLEVLGIL
jgi:hypothetical protein